MKKVGIYISGLGQSVHQESVEKYALRFKNELSYNDTGSKYELKTEKIFYTQERESTVVSILNIQLKIYSLIEELKRVQENNEQ